MLGAADALRHGRFRNQKRAGDFRGGQTADRPERQRDRRRRRQRRMTAHEQERQRVVLLRFCKRRNLLTLRGSLCFAAPASQFAAQEIGHAPRCHLNQPAAGIVGKPFLRPLHRGGDQRFLNGVLGRGEIPVAPHHRPENLRRQLA